MDKDKFTKLKGNIFFLLVLILLSNLSISDNLEIKNNTGYYRYFLLLTT